METSCSNEALGALGYATACWEKGERATQHLVELMRLFEEFSLYAFRRRAKYFIDSGTLLGSLRHRGIVPWDNDIDVAMFDADYREFLKGFDGGSGLHLDRDAYGDPNGCVWIHEASGSRAGLDLSSYTPDGRSRMSDRLQREWPLDAWRTGHDADSWRYDFGPKDLAGFVALPTFCGPQLAPAGFRDRLARHYDDLGMDPQLRERATGELGFDSALPPVQLVREYKTLDEGLDATEGHEPFAVPDCREFRIDREGLERAFRAEPRPLTGHHPSTGLRFDFFEMGAEEAFRRFQENRLELNFFDTPSSLPLSVLPECLQAPQRNPEPHQAYRVGYILSPDRYETIFHADGPMHTYNWLATGEKFWWFVEPHQTTQEWLQGRSITEILTADSFSRWGRVRVVHQRAGTAVVFPGTWLHRVLTYAPSFGLAGYVQLRLPVIRARY